MGGTPQPRNANPRPRFEAADQRRWKLSGYASQACARANSSPSGLELQRRWDRPRLARRHDGDARTAQWATEASAALR